MKRVYLLMAILMVFVGFSTSVNSAILFDDFNDDAGVLTGETANTGQVWEEIPGWSALGRTGLSTGTQFGQSGTTGAGNDDDAACWKGNQIPLGEVVNDGDIILEVDLVKQHRTSPVNEIDVALKSSTQGKETTLIWTADWLKIGGSWDFGGKNINTGVVPAIHAWIIFHLNAGGSNTVEIGFYEIGNPSHTGSGTAPLSIDGTLNYDTVTISAYTAGTKVVGADNLSVTPEPATLSLILLGIVGPLLRKRR